MNPTISTIKSHVATSFGVSVTEIDSMRRSKTIVLPRHLAMYLVRELTSHTLPEIGRYFGDRDHTTIINACQRVEKLIADDPLFAARAVKLRATIPATNEAGEITGNLDEIARTAKRQAVARAKNGGKLAYGPIGDLREALNHLYHEVPVASGKNRIDGTTELLVAPEGSWSILEITPSLSDDFALLSQCGSGWGESS